MKKIILFFMIFSMFLCTACENNIDNHTEKVAKQMISVVDEYLDFEKEADEAEEEIKNLFVRVAEPDENASDATKSLYLEMMYLSNQMNFTSYQIIKKDAAGVVEAEETLLDARNKIAKKIGVRQR